MKLKRTLVAVIAGFVLAAPVWSQPYGMGPGMMGGDFGPGGYGMGPGMMGGYGMGRGMMGGYGLGGLNLTKEQGAKVAEIQKEFSRKQWDLMEKMHDLGWRSGDGERGGALDEQAARKTYDQMAALRKQMFENSLEAQKRIDSVLTPEQREQMRRGWGGR